METIKKAMNYVSDSVTSENNGSSKGHMTSEDEIERFLDGLPEVKPDKRPLSDRIFVNNNLRMDKIKWIGFDMDYTLAQFKSPNFESMMYDLLTETLVKKGYPQKLTDTKYDPNFVIRGIYFDKTSGHLLKIDASNTIVRCYYGRNELSTDEIVKRYKSLSLPPHDVNHRFHPLPKLFQLAEACLYADLVELFYNKPYDDSMIPRPTIDNIFNDISDALDHVHGDSVLKDTAVKDAEKYIEKDKRTAELLHYLNESGFKVFLMTNSNYTYVDSVMSFILEGQNPKYKSWRDYFEFTIVHSGKPNFFEEGKAFRKVDLKNGNPLPGEVKKFEKSVVYQGGSVERFYEMTGLKHGNHVLYVGDSINTDVAKSSLREAWRTFLIVPEIAKELKTWDENRNLVKLLRKLNEQYRYAYISQDKDEKAPPKVEEIKRMREAARALLDERLNQKFGSLFSTNLKNTEFSKKTAQHADIYAASYLNLLNYTPHHNFQTQYNIIRHLSAGSDE